jgi:hypothetical protein
MILSSQSSCLLLFFLSQTVISHYTNMYSQKGPTKDACQPHPQKRVNI